MKNKELQVNSILKGWAAVCFLLLSYPFIFFSHWAANAYAMYVFASTTLLFYTLDAVCCKTKLISRSSVFIFLFAGLPHYSMFITWGGAFLVLAGSEIYG
ncbi:MAG: hypothetical protein DWQ10_09920 [Calditrichaeota bacterium]|nr:MAG: hypothetical protein DWQ10_09920 [Calditrichota bacterium]